MRPDIVIIPTYDRPEYLLVCLERLSYARGASSKEIWIREDNHADHPKDPRIGQFIWEIASFAKNLGLDVIHQEQPEHLSYGNSLNAMTAFEEAYRTDAKHVYLLEDDVMVTADYFEWHEAAQEQFKPFVTCAGRINRSLNFEMNGREAIDESWKCLNDCVRSRKAYNSWASCFRREELGHFVTAYPDRDKWRPGYEQDIFIQQILRTDHCNLKSVWPYVPRAYHMGWYSYHRTAGLKFNGTFAEKVHALRLAISDPAKIREMAGLQEIDPFPGIAHDKLDSKLRIKSDFS